jgi:hypothetical protein
MKMVKMFSDGQIRTKYMVVTATINLLMTLMKISREESLLLLSKLLEIF